MRRTYRKTGSLVVMACLSLLAAGFISNGNVMASQLSHPNHHRMHRVHKPHVTLQVVPNTIQYLNHQYVARAVIYGVGFDNCGNCGSDQGTDNPCDTGCGTPPPPPPTTPSDTTAPCDTGCGTPPTPSDTPAPCDTGCGTPPIPQAAPSPCEAGCTTSHQDVTDKVTTTDVQTTITTTTSTNVSHHSTGCKAGCIPAVPPNTVPCNACSSNNSVPSDNYNNSAPSNNYNNSAPSNNYNNSRNNYNNSRNNYNNSRNNYNNSRNSYNDTTPNATCPSYNSCGTGPNTSTGDTSGCDCNTANLQGNVPFSAPGINLSRVPVNTFGEFRVGVNIRMTPRQARTRPSFWATNTYNGQRSDSAPVPCCSSSFCCS